jgi:diguanylate cyclase (GGDEF)-like protein/PAS domain S-box-containing protein
MGGSGTGRGWFAGLRSRLTGPSLIAVLIVAPLFIIGSATGLLADASVPVIIGLLVGAKLVTSGAYALWGEVDDGWRLYARVGVQVMAIGVVIYGIGWGPTLAIGLLFGVMENVRASGSKATLPSMVGCVVTIAVGQLAIAIGVVPSLVEPPLVHGLGLLAAIGLLFAIQLIGWTTTEKEVAEQELRQSDERLQALVEHASDITMVIRPDGTLAWVSPAFERVLGHAAEDALGRLALGYSHPDDADTARLSLRTATERGGETARTEVRMRHADGSWMWFDASVTNLFDEPAIEGVVVNLRDVSERVNARRELMEAEERFREAFEGAPIGMALADLDGHLFRVNRAMAGMLGYEQHELVGKAITEITYADDLEVSRNEMRRLIEGEVAHYKLEKRYVHAAGHPLWVSLSVSLVRSPDGEPLYQIGQLEDITERKAISERLHHAAIHDALTGLPNRALFVERLATALARAEHHDHRVGVIFLDLDRFKLVNDSLGHATGDRLLKVVADRLCHAIRSGDTVARFGGDEFVVLCDEVADEAAVREVAERVAAEVARPVALSGAEVFVTGSLGVVLSGRPADSPDALVRDADAAMYLAKDHGRARIEVFDERAHVRALDHVRMGGDLHRAIDRGELRVHYQPVVDLETGRVRGFEALVRWMHPTRGLLLPAAFIPLAEETGLIVPIGSWVLEEACRQTVEWQRRRHDEAPLSINVNLAPRQLAEPSFPDELHRILTSTGIDPDAVWLELTEGALMEDVANVRRELETLRGRGVHLAVDDFGTGYSSLAHLKRFPVEALKVDHTFVDGLGNEPEDTSIVTAVINLAHSLGMAAVAEGLETRQQLAELRTMGCDFAQGYLFGAPRSPDEIGERPADDLVAWQHDVS